MSKASTDYGLRTPQGVDIVVMATWSNVTVALHSKIHALLAAERVSNIAPILIHCCLPHLSNASSNMAQLMARSSTGVATRPAFKV
jgi:hypothetical protein